jgi:hypothetical protein
VYVVDRKNKVEYRPVKLGIHVGSQRVIERGVAVSDWVIVNGLQRARPGGVVSPTPAEDATAKTDERPPIDEPTADTAFNATPENPTDDEVKTK